MCVSVDVYCTDVGQLTEAQRLPRPYVFYLHDLKMYCKIQAALYLSGSVCLRGEVYVDF